MEYKLDAGCWNSVFAVPSEIVDQYIRLAGAGALKLMLFMLRHGGKSFSDEQLMDALGMKSSGELEDAALFWVQRGLIKYAGAQATEDTNAFAPSHRKPASISAEQLHLGDLGETQGDSQFVQSAQPTPQKSSARKVGETGLYYTAGDIAERIRTDKEIEGLFKEAEKLYGHTLKPREMQLVISLTDTYGLPSVVAVMLLKYCFRADKATPAYIISVAQSWSDDGINSFELADMRITELERRNGTEEELRRAMERQSKFTKKEREFISAWTVEWGFGTDMIMLAYDRAAERVNGNPFTYMNAILQRWHESGTTTVQQAEDEAKEWERTRKGKSDGAPNAQSAQGNSSFDVEDIMEQIRSKYKNSQ